MGVVSSFDRVVQAYIRSPIGTQPGNLGRWLSQTLMAIKHRLDSRVPHALLQLARVTPCADQRMPFPRQDIDCVSV